MNLNHRGEKKKGLLTEYDTSGEDSEKSEPHSSDKPKSKYTRTLGPVRFLYRLCSIASALWRPFIYLELYGDNVLFIMFFLMLFLKNIFPIKLYRKLWGGFTGELSFALLSSCEYVLFCVLWPIKAEMCYLGYKTSTIAKIAEIIFVCFQIVVIIGSQVSQVSRSLFHVKERGRFLALNLPGHSFHHIYILHFICAIAFYRNDFYDSSEWEHWGWFYWVLVGAVLTVIMLQPILWFIREGYFKEQKKGDREAVLNFIENFSAISDSRKADLLRLGRNDRAQEFGSQDQHQQNQTDSEFF